MREDSLDGLMAPMLRHVAHPGSCPLITSKFRLPCNCGLMSALGTARRALEPYAGFAPSAPEEGP